MQELDLLFKSKCGYYSMHSKICLPIAEKIRSIYQLTETLDNTIFTNYLSYFIHLPYIRCSELSEHRKLILDLLDTVIPTSNDMNSLLLVFHSSHDEKYTELINILQKIIDRKIIIPLDVLYTAIKHNMKTVSEFLVKHVEVNTYCVELACSHGNVELLPQMFCQKIKASAIAVENLLKYYSGKREFEQDIIIHQMNLLFKYGAEPNKECLKYACDIKDKSVIEKILSYKIKPDHECFDVLIDDDRHHYGYHTKGSPAKNADHVADLIDLLVSNGYKLTLEDVFDALHKGYYVHNIKQYGYKIDTEFINKCYQTGYFPYKDLEVKPDIECLRVECRKNGNLKNIKQLVKQGLDPDIHCLRDACRVGSNIGTIRYLIETKSIDPDLQCIKNLAETLNSNSQLKLILSHYNPTKDTSYIAPVIAKADDNSDDESDEKPKKEVAKPAKVIVKRGKATRPVARKKKILPVDDDSISDNEEVPEINKN